MQPETKFWEWFKENNTDYLRLDEIEEELKEQRLDELLSHLHDYCDELYFQIGSDENTHDLIITAEGNKEYFDKVAKLVESAPEIPNWEIISFKPSLGTDFITEYEGMVLNPKDIWFLPLEKESSPGLLGLRVCMENYNSAETEKALSGVYQMLDAILGEKSASLDVQYVEVAGVPNNPEDNGLINISELKEYIDWRKSKLRLS